MALAALILAGVALTVALINTVLVFKLVKKVTGFLAKLKYAFS